MPISKSPRKSLTILGIDPGYADVGYGVLQAGSRRLIYVTCDNLKSSKKLAFGERLLLLDKGIARLIKTHAPDLIAVEKLFFFKNLKTAIDVAQARGVIMLAAARQKVPVVEYTPLEVKQSLTSYGHATKEQVAAMVKRLLGVSLNKPDDAVDALAIAICACFRSRSRQ